MVDLKLLIQIRHSEKVLVMRVFIIVLVLIFSFQSLTKADDIKDFEIEGMSVGDSLLDYMTANEIEQNTLDYFEDKRNYYVVALRNNLNQYDQLEIYLRSGDKKYEIKTIGAFVILDNLEKCFKLQKKIDKDFAELFSNLRIYSATLDHIYDKSGKSKQYQTNYVFGLSADKDDHIRTECTDWSDEIKQKEGYGNNLTVVVMTEEILKWINSGYKL